VEAARDAGYEPWLENFVPLGVNVTDPNVVRLSSRSEFDTLQAAIDAAKEDPGSVTVGADGPLSDDHVAMYALESATGAKFSFVPFAGSSPANRAFLSGEVDIAIGNAFDHANTAEGAADAAVLRPTRYDMIGDVPTAQESLGLDLKGFGSTRGFAAPAGSPEDLVEAYRRAFELTFNDPEYQEEARSRNITIVEPAIGEEFGALMRDLQETADNLMPLFVEGGYIEEIPE
jgi:tripartite-type tricarboxylate transporter receptor subunit TctC